MRNGLIWFQYGAIVNCCEYGNELSCSLFFLYKPCDLASKEVPRSVELESMYTTYSTAWWKTELMYLLCPEKFHQWHGNADAGLSPIVRGEAVIGGLCSKSLLQSLCGVPWRGERLDGEGPPFCLVDAVWSTCPVSQEIMHQNNGATRKHKKRENRRPSVDCTDCNWERFPS